jgi:hypothetical protein
VTFTEMWLALQLPAGASPQALDAAEARLGITFPTDYREVMVRADGGDKEFGESWVVLDSRNEDSDLMQFFPDLTFFGGDGAGEAYGWDRRARRGTLYILTPLIGNVDDDAIACGGSFEEFLSILHSGVRFNR